jgi:ubiquinone/menaquinone biosynthesis C-methylase UbiE
MVEQASPILQEQPSAPTFQDKILNLAGRFLDGSSDVRKEIEKKIAWDRANHLIESSHILDYLQQGKKYLGIGSGPGHFDHILRKKGNEVFSSDPYIRPFLSFSKEDTSVSYQRSLHAFGQYLPIAKESVDGVIIGFTFHHIPGKDWLKTFTEARRVLKKDGRLYILEDVPESISDSAAIRSWDRWTNGEIGDLVRNLFKKEGPTAETINNITLDTITSGEIKDLHLSNNQWLQLFTELGLEVETNTSFSSKDPLNGNKEIKHRLYVVKEIEKQEKKN